MNFLDAIESSGWSSNGITHNDAGRLIVENEYGKYINNGIIETHLDEGKQLPEGFIFGRLRSGIE